MYTKFGLDTKQTCDKKSQKNILRRKYYEKMKALETFSILYFNLNSDFV